MPRVPNKQQCLVGLRVLATSGRNGRTCDVEQGLAVDTNLGSCEIHCNAPDVDTAVQQASIQIRRICIDKTRSPGSLRSSSRKALVTSNAVLDPKGICIVCTIVYRAECHAGSRFTRGTIDGNTTISVDIGSGTVAGKGGIWEAVGICICYRIHVRDSSAASQDIAEL